VRYVSARLSGSEVLVGKIEDRIARKASDPASSKLSYSERTSALMRVALR
jgi:hypothetical protein